MESNTNWLHQADIARARRCFGVPQILYADHALLHGRGEIAQGHDPEDSGFCSEERRHSAPDSTFFVKLGSKAWSKMLCVQKRRNYVAKLDLVISLDQ